jgi:hypothetical protein
MFSFKIHVVNAEIFRGFPARPPHCTPDVAKYFKLSFFTGVRYYGRFRGITDFSPEKSRTCITADSESAVRRRKFISKI